MLSVKVYIIWYICIACTSNISGHCSKVYENKFYLFSTGVDANGSMSSPGPISDGMVDGNHSGPPSLHREVDSPPIPPHPLHGPPPMLPMMFPPGVPPPHGLPPGVPPPPPGLPHGLPPPFLPGEPPFMGPLPPLPGGRLPPAGGMSSPPFRRSGSPSYEHRNDRYSPRSDRSHFSDGRYSPPILRRRPPSPDSHRNRSPDRRSDRTRSPDMRSDRMRRSPDSRGDRRSPDRRSGRRSPDRRFARSPDGYVRHRSPPRHFYDDPEYNDDPRLHSHLKGMHMICSFLLPMDGTVALASSFRRRFTRVNSSILMLFTLNFFYFYFQFLHAAIHRKQKVHEAAHLLAKCRQRSTINGLFRL